MKIYKTDKGYFYKELNTGKKIRLSKEDYLKIYKKNNEKVIFFDDSFFEIKNAKKYKNINIYYVKDNLYKDYDSYLNILSNKTLKFIHNLEVNYNNKNDIIKGIPINLLKNLNKLILNKTISKIVFDWDFTLSLFEGWYCDMTFTELKNNINDNFSNLNNYAEYLLGGYKRIKILKDIFNNAKKVNIPIFILTNNIALDNPYKYNKNKYNFYNLLKSVNINIELNNILFNTYLPGYKLDFINEIILKNNNITFNKINHNFFITISKINNSNKNKNKYKKYFYEYYNQLNKINHYDKIQLDDLKKRCLMQIY